MCGICGVLASTDVPDPALVVDMLAALAHRGPDGSGYYRDERVALGHTRLAIVDTVGGTQPMTGRSCPRRGEDERVWVTFNGEIFNHVELAAELRSRGHVFDTRSDTEVIVHAWEEWGPGCFDRFNGQWALAIWDRRTRALVLSRDRFGVRPLFYTRAAGKLLFASEVKALYASPEVPRELDPVGLDQVLTLWSAVAPRTVFRDVAQVPPGSYLSFRDGGELERRYWSPSFPPAGAEDLTDLASNAEALRTTLAEATRLRFERSDVPVAAYLSGGIDSAVIAGAIATTTSAPLHTFSLRFADAEFDEGRFQRLMAERLGTVHHDVVVGERDIADIFPDVVRHAESPLLRTAPAPMFLLSRLVRDAGFKVVVTGEGADEVLGGYDIFREAKIRDLWLRDPEAAEAAVGQLYPWMHRSPNQAPAFAQSFFSRNLSPHDLAMSHRPRWDSAAVLASMLRPEIREPSELVEAGDAPTGVVAAMPAAASSWDPVARAQWLEMTTLLPGYILASQGDRMLMGSSVEGRFPFLDPRVAALAERVPAEHKIYGMDEKHLLKLAFADLVPEEILRRSKQPYRAPDAAAFFAGGTPDWVLDVTSERALETAGIFRAPLVQRLLEKARRTHGRGLGNTDNMRLVAVLSTQLLHSELLADPRVGASAPPEPLTVIDHLLEPIGRTSA